MPAALTLALKLPPPPLCDDAGDALPVAVSVDDAEADDVPLLVADAVADGMGTRDVVPVAVADAESVLELDAVSVADVVEGAVCVAERDAALLTEALPLAAALVVAVAESVWLVVALADADGDGESNADLDAARLADAVPVGDAVALPAGDRV